MESPTAISKKSDVSNTLKKASRHSKCKNRLLITVKETLECEVCAKMYDPEKHLQSKRSIFGVSKQNKMVIFVILLWIDRKT